MLVEIIQCLKTIQLKTDNYAFEDFPSYEMSHPSGFNFQIKDYCTVDVWNPGARNAINTENGLTIYWVLA